MQDVNRLEEIDCSGENAPPQSQNDRIVRCCTNGQRQFYLILALFLPSAGLFQIIFRSIGKARSHFDALNFKHALPFPPCFRLDILFQLGCKCPTVGPAAVACENECKCPPIGQFIGIYHKKCQYY